MWGSRGYSGLGDVGYGFQLCSASGGTAIGIVNAVL